MAVSRSQLIANMRYHDKNYERLVVDLKKGKKDFYKAEAAKRGLSLAMLVQKSVEEYIANHSPNKEEN